MQCCLLQLITSSPPQLLNSSPSSPPHLLLMSSRLFLLFLIASFSLLCPPSYAQSVDTLKLDNGITVPGAFKGWKRGELEFKTKGGLGTVFVEADDVKSVTGMLKEYRVVSTKGKIYYGKIGAMSDDKIHVITADGDHYIPFHQIVDITLYTGKSIMPLDGSIGAGYNFSLGNDVGVLNLDLEAYYEFKKLTLDIIGTSSMIQKDGDLTRTRDQLELSSFRILNSRWQFGLKGLYQQNTKQGLDLRALVVAGPLYRPVMSTRGEIWLFAGFAMSKETAIGGGSQTQQEIPMLLNAKVYSFNKPNLSLETTQTVFWGTVSNYGTRHEGDLKLRWEFMDDFSLSLSGYSTYDPTPISATGKKWDTGIKTGIEVEF